jgi:hypothetical protein
MSATSNAGAGYVAAAGNKTYPSKFFFWRVCAWAGPLYLLGYILSWGVLGYNIPPIDPGMSITDLQAHYVDHSMRIRVAMVFSVFFAPLYFVFSSVLSRIMQKIEGPDGPLSIIEQMGGAVTTVVILVGGICWLTAAFRVDERTAEGIRQLHDFGWMFFDTTYMATSLQMVAVALVLLNDKRAVPLFPGWVAWFSIFVAAVFVPITLIPFFLDGPFAWNGLFNYWVGFTAFFLWVTFYSFYAFKAIARLEQEDAAANA